MKERVLIIGNGGREHALKWKLEQSPGVGEALLISPSSDIDSLVRFSSDSDISLTIVGPEAPLEKGVVNVYLEEGLPIFGPTKEAAQLETSKVWAIGFMQRHNIPHPDSVIFTDLQKALFFIEHPKWNGIVIKASGLAAGKGVILPDTLEEAKEAIHRIMVKKEFDSGEEVIVQERLRGREVSILAITDGKTVVPMLPAQDHKRVYDGDKGPNTGGMGAFAPALVKPETTAEIYETILKPIVEGMRKEGTPFKGILYAGLMLTPEGPKVLEYNVRFGDPETQPLMMLLSSDLYKALKAVVGNRLTINDIKFRSGSALCVVLTAEGYPGKYRRGDIIYGLEKTDGSDIQIFQAGTKEKGKRTITNGGRILGVTAFGENLSDARRKAYAVIGRSGIHFEGMHYRKDIGLTESV